MSYVVECAVPGRPPPPVPGRPQPPPAVRAVAPGMPSRDEGGRDAGRVGATEASDAADDGGRIASCDVACAT
eukprot:3792025-Prymnesium_polylepis.1